MNLQSSRWASSQTSTYNKRHQSPPRPLISSGTTYASNRATSPQPTQHNPSPAEQSRLDRASELARHRRLLRRLRWKLPSLATSHHLATTIDLSHHHYASISPADADALAAARREAELMFKLDWFEYYTVLERALLHLLGVFDIRISRYGDRDGGFPAPMSTQCSGAAAESETETPSIIGTAAYASPYAHRFHANVLASLDTKSNPLHQVLGQGDVRASLAKAKELRNRWKDADERADEEGVIGGGDARGVAAGREREVDGSPAPLSSYDTERMLRSIFEGFERALEIAERAVTDVNGDTGLAQAAGEGRRLVNGRYVEDDDGDMMMEDAMDWEEL